MMTQEFRVYVNGDNSTPIKANSEEELEKVLSELRVQHPDALLIVKRVITVEAVERVVFPS